MSCPEALAPEPPSPCAAVAAIHGVHLAHGVALLLLHLLSVFFHADSLLLRGDLWARELLDQLGGRHLERRKIGEPRLHLRVIYGIGIELPVNPFGESDLANVFDVAGARPVPEAVEAREGWLPFRSAR